MPPTGTPEPAGLEGYEVNDLVRGLVARRRLVGFDMVELLPQPGQHASDFLAAKLVYRVLAEAWASSLGRTTGIPGGVAPKWLVYILL